ncbi:hypothetical protein TCE0_022f06639 [Talaromyces pinophilus]|uniref:Uncharacterized protein n=1 Tax=Talaromyces pinophilus TaxID=128442 RepID=A0A6V8H7K1_TALPI|nr:hypothetical protein TCE0_022f06639 [Talaromyces pinophilus]
MFELRKPRGSTGARDLTFDVLVNKALEEIVNNASAQIIDIIDKAPDRHSNHVKDPQLPTAKDAGQQQAVADATAATDDGSSGKHAQQDVMRVKGTNAVVSMHSIGSEDKCPRPNNIYVIHLKNYHNYALASDYHWEIILRPPADAHPDFFESFYCQWLCEEWCGWLHFRNMDTGKYLGIEYGREGLSWPVLSADHDGPDVVTRFCAMRDESGRCVLRIPMNGSLLTVQAVLSDDLDLPFRLGNLKQKVALVCKDTTDGTYLPSFWSFEEVEEVE